ncbi:hypothetical protein TcBrA4_0110550 [Trypanosoma cruzi]|nr:hypothetical protein TcBrA4_0110550 [Trypanosoma cruzi]
MPSHTGRRAGWDSPKQSQSIFSMTRAFPQWMRRSLPWSVRNQLHVASVMRRWRKSLVHLECPRLCFLRALPYWHAWIFGGDQRKAPAKKTVAKQSRHPHVRPCQTTGTPGRARRACAVILWTDERALWQIEQEDFDPPLAGRQGVAVLTSGRGSGGGRGGPVSSVKKGTAPPAQRVPCDPQGARACRRVGRSRIAPVRGAATRARCPGQHQEQSPRHSEKRLSRGVRLPFPPGISFSTAA